MENDRFFRSIVENASDIIARYDRDLTCLYINPSFERATGIKPEPLIGKRLGEQGFPDAIFRQWERAFGQVFESGKAGELEIMFQTPRGERAYHSRFIPEFGPDGVVETVLAVTRDVTAKIQLQSDLKRYRDELERLAIERSEELSDSEEKYHSLIENIPDVTWTTKRDGSTVFISNNIKRVFGYSQDEIYADPSLFLPRIHPDDRNRVTKAFDAMFEKGIHFDVEYRIQRKDGEWIWLHDRAITTYKKDGEFYADGVLYDFTDRKRAEEALRESRARYQDLYDNAPDMFVSVEAATGKIVNCNRTLATKLGYTKDEIMGRPIFDMYHPDSLEGAREVFKSFVDTGEVRDAELQLMRKDGGKIDVLLNVSAVRDGEGNVLYSRSSWRDITDRKRALADLERSEERFRHITENAREWIWETDADGLYTYSSHVIEEILGYAPDEVVGKKHFYDFFHPDEREALKVAAFAAFADKRPFREFPNCNLHRDGSEVWLLTSGAPILDEEGRLQGYRGADVDITDRKCAEDELNKERQELSLILNASPTIIFYKDDGGKFVRVNKALAESLQISEEEFMGKTVFDLYSPKIAQRMTGDDQEVIQSGRPKLNIIESYESARGIRWVQTNKIPTYSKNGSVSGLVGFAQDITDLKRAEESLRESETLLRSTIESTADGILVVGEGGRVILTNKRFAEMWHIPGDMIQRGDDEELLGYVLEQLREPEAFLKRVRELYGSRRHDFDSFQFKDGRVFDRLSFPLVRDGKVAGRVWSFRDMTSLREVQLMRERLVREASHSLKTPAAMIEMALDIYRKGKRAGDKVRMDRALEMMSDNVKSIRGDIDRIMQMNVLDMPRAKLGMRRRSSTRKAVRDLLRVHRHLIEEKGLSVKVDISQGAEMAVIAREDLRVLVGNILDNAVKFTKEGRISITGRVRGGNVELRIEDTGIGVPASHIGKVFDRFYQVHAVTKGTGLGLAICKEIVDIYGGSISLVSKGKGRGTTVSIVLPR